MTTPGSSLFGVQMGLRNEDWDGLVVFQTN